MSDRVPVIGPFGELTYADCLPYPSIRDFTGAELTVAVQKFYGLDRNEGESDADLLERARALLMKAPG